MHADFIDLDITDVAHGGVFVGRHEGRVVFVPDAIPGERVRVRLTDAGASGDTRSFWRGEAIEILDASPHRRPHVWRAADVDVPPEQRPGGADFGHIRLEHQRELKAQVLSDALTRIGKLDLPVSLAAPAERVRRRHGLAHPREPARRRRGPHRPVRGAQPPRHPGRRPPARDSRGRRGGARGSASARPGRIDLVQPADGRVRVIPRPETPRPPRRAGRRVGAVAQRVPGRRPSNEAATEVVVEEVARSLLPRRRRRLLAGAPPCRAIAHRSSWRSELREAGSVDPDAWHLDLYGGVGLFAATLGELGGPSTRVTTVESDARATEHAGENLAEWVGARAETARVDRWIAWLADEASDVQRDRLSRGVVLLDPPRSGAGRQVVEGVAALGPATVVYVACDPVALARDLATFRTAGYESLARGGAGPLPELAPHRGRRDPHPECRRTLDLAA